MKSFKQINAEVIELIQQVQGNSTSPNSTMLNLNDILTDLEEAINTSSHHENEDLIELQNNLLALRNIYTPADTVATLKENNLGNEEEKKGDLEESTIETTVQKIDRVHPLDSVQEKINHLLSLGNMYALGDTYHHLTHSNVLTDNELETAKNDCKKCLEYYQQASELISESTMTIRLPSFTLSKVLLHPKTSFDDIMQLIQKLDTLTSSSKISFEMDKNILDTLIRRYPPDPEIKALLPDMLQRIQKNVINVSTQSSLHIEQHSERQKAEPRTSWWSRPLSFTFCPPSCSTNAVNENAYKQAPK